MCVPVVAVVVFLEDNLSAAVEDGDVVFGRETFDDEVVVMSVAVGAEAVGVAKRHGEIDGEVDGVGGAWCGAVVVGLDDVEVGRREDGRVGSGLRAVAPQRGEVLALLIDAPSEGVVFGGRDDGYLCLCGLRGYGVDGDRGVRLAVVDRYCAVDCWGCGVAAVAVGHVGDLYDLGVGDVDVGELVFASEVEGELVSRGEGYGEWCVSVESYFAADVAVGVVILVDVGADLDGVVDTPLLVGEDGFGAAGVCDVACEGS